MFPQHFIRFCLMVCLVIAGCSGGGVGHAQTQFLPVLEPYPADVATTDAAPVQQKALRIAYTANVVCYGDSLMLWVDSTDYEGSVSGFHCEWFYNGHQFETDGNQFSIVFSPPSNNIRIWFHLYDGYSLVGADTMTVFVTDPPTGYTMQHDTICRGNEATVGVAGRVGGSAGRYWDWVTTGTTQFINDRPLVSTDYRVYFSQYPIREYGYKNRCYTTDYAHVEVLTEPYITIIGDSAVCLGNNTVIELLDARDILWRDGSTSAVYPVNNVQYDLTLQVLATDRFGCRGVRQWEIKAVERPDGAIGASQDTLNLGEDVSVWMAYTNADSIIWFNREQADTLTVSPKQSMDIYADLYIGRHGGGCATRIYKHIEVLNNVKVHFPTGFKLDGMSREYKPIGIIEPNKSYYFAIFNRNGQRVFETRDISVGWDGKFKGEWVHPGVFVFYYKETFDRFTNELNGTITVVK